jgi:hypothetical protein
MVEKENNAPWISSMEVASKQQILKETFAQNQPFSAPQSEPVASSHTSPPLSKMKWEIQAIEEPATSFSAVPFQSPILSIPSPISLSLPPPDSLNLFEHLPKDLIIPRATSPIETFLPSHLLEKQPSLASSPPVANDKEIAPPSIHPDTLIANSWNFHPQAAKAPSVFPPPQMPELPSLAELDTVSQSDAFDAELVFLPREGEEGYFFALTLIPRPDLKLPKLKQHYFFLIDRSNSIQSERLFSTKNAIRRALDDLEEDDLFNIIAFDSKLEKMSSVELKPTPQSKAKAEAFLDTIKLGSFFAGADLSKALLMTVPTRVNDDELYSAILFTDGEIFSKKSNQRDILYHWSHYNGGKVSLFPISVSSDPHIATLDAAAMFNKGKLFYAPTHRGIKRKALKAMKAIHSPVAKNLSSRAIPLTPQTHISLYPKTVYLPHLYLNEPYVIMGTCDTLDDFILFLQGRLNNRWLNIKKKISFLTAKRGGQSLKSEWALQAAYQHYEAFLIDGNSQHLADAHELLAPHNIQVAFE